MSVGQRASAVNCPSLTFYQTARWAARLGSGKGMKALADRPLDLREIAVGAYQEDLERSRREHADREAAERRAAEARSLERARRIVESLTGQTVVLGVNADVDDALLGFGGLWLTAEVSDFLGNWRLVLVTRCESCGLGIYRDPVTSLAELGRAVEAQATRDAICPACDPRTAHLWQSHDELQEKAEDLDVDEVTA